MDGVIADFIGGVCDWFKVEDPYERPEMKGSWDVVSALGMAEEEFWKTLGYDFWINLKKTPEADDIVCELTEFFGEENICILTSPCATKGCRDAKQDWIAHHFPQFKDQVYLGKNKRYVAHPQSFLLDDYDRNVEIFSKRGHALLFPRPWNSQWFNENAWMARLHDFLEIFDG